MTTTLTQASQQWISRPADERFLSLIDMQAFKRPIGKRPAIQGDQQPQACIPPLGRERARPDDHRDESGYHSTPTHWSFGQLCSLASPGNSPASYFRETRMPAPMIADCLNYNLRFTRGVEESASCVTRTTSLNELRSVNGPNYGRIYDADMVDTLVERSATASPALAGAGRVRQG